METKAQPDAGTATLREYVRLRTEADNLKTRLEVVEQHRKELEPAILEWFASSGVNRINVDGVTVYVRRELWASAKDGDKVQAAAALKASGMEDYVSPTFNVQQVSAYFRELDREGVEPPPELAAAFKVTETFKLAARKDS